MKKNLIVILIFIFCLPVAGFSKEDPMAAVKKPIEEGLQLLKDPQYQDPAKKMEQREKFWAIVKNMFDFKEVSMRALARNWRLFKPAQKEEFTALFSELLGNTYVDRIQEGFENEEVVFKGQEKISDNRAVVKTKIVGGNSELAIDYRLKYSGNRWLVYDVHAEGISLIKNYRRQFNKILLKKKPSDLIEQLRKKVESQRQAKPTASLRPLRAYFSLFLITS